MKLKDNIFKSSEDLVSMFLGVVIVLIAGGLIFNYFQKRSGNISLEGVKVTVSPTIEVSPTQKQVIAEIAPSQTMTIVEGDYVVKPGDSLWKIAQDQLGSGYRWKDIANNNKIKNGSIIEIGQRLNLKGIETSNTADGKGGVDQSVYGPLIEGNSYDVAKGDTLSKISARAYGDVFAWNRIFEANKSLIKQPSLILPGWKLVIPR